MRIIGISPLDKDSTVSFVEDGRVVFACAEERLSRVKLQSGFPDRALALAFARTGWKPESVDAVAYAFFDWEEEERLIREAVAEDKRAGGGSRLSAAAARFRQAADGDYRIDRTVRIPGLETEASEFVAPKGWVKRGVYSRLARSAWLDWRAHRWLFGTWVNNAVEDHRKWSGELASGLKRFNLDRVPLKRFHHHDTHAANAYYASGFDRALAVTLDGYGSGCCGGIYTVGPEGIKALHRFRFPNSLGIFYEHVTSGLGFKPSRHEGKIVGLAAYGNPKILADVLLERFVVENGDIRINGALNHFLARALAGRFAKRDVAAAYQYVLEEVTRRSVTYWIAKTRLNRVVMSGGVNANVKLNQRIREIPGVEAVFVYPNMGDGGCGTGAAMLATGHDRMPRSGFDTVYFGPDYSEAEIRGALESESLQFERCDDIEDRVAELLASNAIVGRFNGRMEYGPRALGNRSVLYPAREPEVNQWLNKQLGRTEFMPFAPACLAEEAPRLFKNLSGCEKTAEFMTITFDCTDEMKRQSPAAVHVDGTARPQLVRAETNPSFHRILKAYYSRTGIPVLINTSFNMHEEPIVGSPADAVHAFLLGNIDYLAVGPFLVPHPKLADNVRARRPAAAPVAVGVG
ncbi:MAG TPA: carbamoyltransferase C-terminal domain-containing protein [Gemmata sp.]|nr:carbamoyltransferase C-terminal domain-containing protein [Gemmata sp.]